MLLIILGNSRSGKTMLAREICLRKSSYSLISMDHLVMSFKKVFPDLKIDYYSKEETVFTNFIEEYLDNCTYKNSGINYIFEGILPQSVADRLNLKDNTKLMYLGKPNISAEDFFNEIRYYENGLVTGGWTKKLDDKTLLSWCSSWIKNSKNIQEYCKEHNIPFFDTSFNQMQVIDEIIKKII